MNFIQNLLKSFRILLFPFSLLYGLIVIFRNYLYDKNIFRRVSFDLPVIAVGNLSAGGTGKSPMVEYLIILLKDKYKAAIVSRGYKRKTKGYVLANANTTAIEIGDEPMQFHLKFPGVAVAAGEERIMAIPQLLQDKPETEVIILDDAFQHRSIKPGFNILLTEHDNLFTRDFFLPAGDLRDQKSSYKRADVIVVTKCPPDLSHVEKDSVKKEINPFANQKVFFTTTEYGLPYHIITAVQPDTFIGEVLLVCGIANPTPLKNYLSHHTKNYRLLSFSDHHTYTVKDIAQIRKEFDDMEADAKMIITTEKDAARLIKFNKELVRLPVYALPVKHRFLFGEGIQFDSIVKTFIERFKEDK